jgi:aminoglycoside phosphotransferase (APT) family kinase protein/RimJ/RimL family protein N-acetyltransferase
MDGALVPHLRVVPAKRAWLAALVESDEAFTALTGVPVERGWMAELPGIVPYCLQRLDAGDDPAWSIHLFFDADHGGALVGNGGWKGVPVDGVAELGYAVAPACRNRGIARGAVAVLLAQASAAGLHTVVAHTLREPSASTRVLERSGFRCVGDEHEGGAPVWRWERPVRPDDPVQMHVDEFDTDAELVRRLLRAQHPHWADRSITRVPSAGTDNAMYRLGDDLVARLPRIGWAVGNVAKEQHWLPALAPHLPLAVPQPVAEGSPTDDFPYPWSVVRWLPGLMATLDVLDDPAQAARDLAAFVRALREVDPADGPRHNRGGSLRRGDRMVRDGVALLDGEVDVDALLAVWSEAVAATEHPGPPVWFHGDLSYLNVLATDGRVSGIIDWGCCGVGDPAIDMIVAWSLLSAGARDVYREELGVDDAEWARGKGWVVTGVFGIPYYRYTNPVLVADKLHAISTVLEES